MYYLMSNDDEILDSLSKMPTQDELNKMARIFCCCVWVLRGEHTGMSAEYKNDSNSEPPAQSIA